MARAVEPDVPTSMKASRFSAVRRHWWLVATGIVAGLAGSYAAFTLTPSAYVSSASVLVQPVPTQSAAGQLAGAEINLNTEAELARSTQTATEAAAQLGDGQRPDDLVESVAVEVIANTSVLVVRFEAATPAAAQAGAQAFAQAYLANRTRAAANELTGVSAALAKKINETTQQLAVLDLKINRLPAGSAQLDTLRANRQTLTDQINTLTARNTDLATTTINGGRIIRAADQPTEPIRPPLGLMLGAGLLVGAGAGLAAAIGRDRLSGRVRGGGDVAARTGLTVLAEFGGDLPGLRTLAPRVFAPHHGPGRAFHRLRNEVVAALPPADRVILVTGASVGRASTVVAANLAAALARADNEVILVGANVPELGTDGLLLSHVFDVADVPGLTDVLAGRAQLSAALQRAPRAPRLRLITPGGTASAAGLLQSEAVRVTLQSLRDQARYIVVEAPSAASGADAQSLAGLADVAILVVEAGRARHTEVADAARQLELIGTRVLGAIVLPTLAAPLEEPDDDSPDGQTNPALRATDTWINPTTMNAPTALHPVVPDAAAADPRHREDQGGRSTTQPATPTVSG